MKTSIVILSYYHPEIIEICLRTLQITEGDYEVIVVDNGSDSETIIKLKGFEQEGLIDKLVSSATNLMFSAGNNLGVSWADPESEYILLLNSDVAFMRPDWLQKQIAWMEGTMVPEETVWNLHPTINRPGKRDVVSIGWSHDPSVVPANARPEGWCCMYRKSVWQDMSEDFPWYYGFEEQIGKIGHAGGRIGVLWNYSTYLTHAEQGSGTAKEPILNKRTPDIGTWMSGCDIETLDFTLGPNEHQSYLKW